MLQSCQGNSAKALQSRTTMKPDGLSHDAVCPNLAEQSGETNQTNIYIYIVYTYYISPPGSLWVSLRSTVMAQIKRVSNTRLLGLTFAAFPSPRSGTCIVYLRRSSALSHCVYACDYSHLLKTPMAWLSLVAVSCFIHGALLCSH